MSSNTENLPQNVDQPKTSQQRQEVPHQQTQQKKENQIQVHQSLQNEDIQDQQNLLMAQENLQGEQNNDEPKPISDLGNNLQNSMELNSRIQNNHRNSLNSLSNEKVISCNCKKSKCLKMYCQCYAKGNKCRDTCKCTNCQNTKNSIRERKFDCQNDQEIDKSQESNKKSIKQKERSCNCKRSFCLKKYCECFNANQACTQTCKCQDCKNNGQNNGFREDKNQSSIPVIDTAFYPLTISKQISQAFSENNGFYDKKQDLPCPKRRQKLDQDQIETKISQILKLVPQQNYQTMLDFLAYYLS